MCRPTSTTHVPSGEEIGFISFTASCCDAYSLTIARCCPAYFQQQPQQASKADQRLPVLARRKPTIASPQKSSGNAVITPHEHRVSAAARQPTAGAIVQPAADKSALSPLDEAIEKQLVREALLDCLPPEWQARYGHKRSEDHLVS